MIQLAMVATATQTALFEEHTLERVKPGPVRSHVGVCACGWESPAKRNQRAAELEVISHSARVLKFGTP